MLAYWIFGTLNLISGKLKFCIHRKYKSLFLKLFRIWPLNSGKLRISGRLAQGSTFRLQERDSLSGIWEKYPWCTEPHCAKRKNSEQWERKKKESDARTRHKEPLRRWLTSRPVPFLSFRVRAKARNALVSAFPSSLGKQVLFLLPRASSESAGREDTRASRSGKERLGSESGAYISAGTNCPIIHSVRRQRCSSAYPRPLLLPPRFRRRSPPTPPGVCSVFAASKKIKSIIRSIFTVNICRYPSTFGVFQNYIVKWFFDFYFFKSYQ